MRLNVESLAAIKLRFNRERLTAEREAHGLSKRQLAQIMGVAPMQVTRWENGDTAPEAERMLKLALLFGLDLFSMFLIESAK